MTVDRPKSFVIATNIAVGAGSVLAIMPPARIVTPGSLRGTYNVQRSFEEAAQFIKGAYEKETVRRSKKSGD